MTTYILGIQWSFSALRLACFRKTAAGYQLVHLDRLTFATGESALKIAALRQWVTENLPKGASVQAVLSVPESQVILKELELPNFKPQELSEAIAWEVTNKSGAFPGESVVQWQTFDRHEQAIRVAAMLMKQEDTAFFASIFQKAGLPLVAIEPSALSARRAISSFKPTVVLLTMEANEVNLIFLEQGVPVFSTSVTLPASPVSEKRRRFSRDALAVLISSLKRTLSYWEKKEHRKVQEIMLTGEAAAFSGLRRGLKTSLHLAVSIGSVAKDGWSDPQKFSSDTLAPYTIAIGAALRCLDFARPEAVNFLPKEQIAILEREATLQYLTHSLYRFIRLNSLVLVIFLALFGGLRYWQMQAEGEISQTQKFVGNHPAQKDVELISRVNTVADQVSQLMAVQQDFGERLRYLASAIPPRLKLNSLKLANATSQQWTLEGIGDRAEILAFYDKLRADARVKEVTMPYSNFEKVQAALFRINILW